MVGQGYTKILGKGCLSSSFVLPNKDILDATRSRTAFSSRVAKFMIQLVIKTKQSCKDFTAGYSGRLNGRKPRRQERGFRQHGSKAHIECPENEDDVLARVELKS